jgi:hypothetical protein
LGLTSFFPVSPTCCYAFTLHRHRSEPYDPYLPRGGSSSNPSGAGNPKTAAIQAQIDDTVGIMRDNITKVAERGERLDQLQDKTGMFSSLPNQTAPAQLCLGCSAFAIYPLIHAPQQITSPFLPKGSAEAQIVCARYVSALHILPFYSILIYSSRICGKHLV